MISIQLRPPLKEKIENVEKIIKNYTKDVLTIMDQKTMDEIYKARKGAYSALLNQREKKNEIVIIGDVIVPASELPATLKEIKNAVDKMKINVSLFGHIGGWQYTCKYICR